MFPNEGKITSQNKPAHKRIDDFGSSGAHVRRLRNRKQATGSSEQKMAPSHAKARVSDLRQRPGDQETEGKQTNRFGVTHQPVIRGSGSEPRGVCVCLGSRSSAREMHCLCQPLSVGCHNTSS